MGQIAAVYTCLYLISAAVENKELAVG